MVTVTVTKGSYPGSPDTVTTVLSCDVSAAKFYGPPLFTFRAQLPPVKTKAIADLNALFNSIISRIESASPGQFDTVVSTGISEWSTSIGDQHTGIFGSFNTSVNQLISAAYKSVQQLMSTNKCAMSNASSEQSKFTSSINSLSQSAMNELSSTITSLNASFNTRLNAAASKAFPARLKIFTDKFLAGLEKLETSSSTVDDFSRGIDSLNGALTSEIGSVKYAGTNAQDVITASMTPLNDAVRASSNRVYSKILGGSLQTLQEDISNRVSSIQSMFDSSISPIRDVAIADIAKFASSFVNNMLSSFIEPKSFIDSPSTRSFWNDFKRSTSSSFSRSANDKFKAFQNNLRVPISSYSSARDALTNYYNDKLQSSVISSSDAQAQVDSINAIVSKLLSDLDAHVQATLKSASLAVYNAIIAAGPTISSKLNEFVSRYPLIRFTGDYNIPTRVDTSAPTKFSFSVRNIGGAAWTGFFGVKIVGSDGGSWSYNDRPAALLSLAPGATQSFEVVAPFNKILAGKTFPPSEQGFIIVNTILG